MIVVYDGIVNGVHLQLHTCAPDLNTGVDHLHFTIEFKEDMWHEHFEGQVFVYSTDTIYSIIDRTMAVYAEGWVKSRLDLQQSGNTYNVTSYQLQ